MKTNIRILFFLFLSVAGVFQTFSQHDLTGYWEDNFGMHYYVRHIDNTIYWFGEHKQGIWSGAFQGTISGNTREALFRNRPATINGNIYDLPKGSASTQAQLGLRVISSNEMRKASGPFSATVFRKKPKPRNLPGLRSAGFESNGINGLWKSDDGGTYYMRQIGNKVIWFGERNKNSQTAFSNVGFGTRTGNTINLDWVDVPKGRTTRSGTLILRVNNNSLTKTNRNNFGGTRWTKSDKKEFDISLLNTLLESFTSQINVHLNNYTPQKGPYNWFRRNDAYIKLPDAWGGKIDVSIPEIKHNGPLRNYYYYVQDLNSAPNGVTAEIQPKSSFRIFNTSNPNAQKKPVIKIAIRLEMDGTEIKGRCGGRSSDKMAPDIHISTQNDPNFPIIYIYIPLEVHRGQISYGDVKTYFDAKIQAGGICKIADRLCNAVTNYRARIIEEIDEGLKEEFNDPNVRRNFELSLNSVLPREANGSLTKLVLEGDKIIFEHN